MRSKPRKKQDSLALAKHVRTVLVTFPHPIQTLLLEGFKKELDRGAGSMKQNSYYLIPILVFDKKKTKPFFKKKTLWT